MDKLIELYRDKIKLVGSPDKWAFYMPGELYKEILPLIENRIRTEEEERAISISQKSPYTYHRVLSALEYLDQMKIEWFHLDDDWLARNLQNLTIAAGLISEIKRREELENQLSAVQVSAMADSLISKFKIPASGNRHERRKARKQV